MSGLTRGAMDVLRTHHGVATAEMLRQTGVGRHVRERLVDAGVLEVVYERVFRIRSAPDTEVARSAAICLAYPHAYITGPSGGRLTMVRRMPKDDEVHVGISHGCNIGPIDGVRLRQTRNLQPRLVQGRRPDGIRLASAPRLAFDLGADLSPADQRIGRRAAPARAPVHVRLAADHRPEADPPAATRFAGRRRHARHAW